MRKIALILSAVSIAFASPAAAAPLSSDEVAAVADVAKRICPLALSHAQSGADAESVTYEVLAAAKRARYSLDEQHLLLSYCVLFNHGVLYGVKLERSN